MKTTPTLHLPIDNTELAELLRAAGVIKASVFGSYARNEQTSKSDLDLLVKVSRGTSLFDLFDLQAELEQRSGVKVDLVTKLNRHFAPYIKPELVSIAL